MSNHKPLIGKTFNHLLVLDYAYQDVHKRWYYLCSCTCGKESIVASRHLLSGATKSCGCLLKTAGYNGGLRNKELHSGANSHLWKPELTTEQRLEKRNLVLQREWRNQVYIRDSYKCCICGTHNKLVAHHLNSWAVHKEDRFKVENGITLCKTHHHEFHMWNGGYRQETYRELFYMWYIQRKLNEI